jgi:A/G-specific adenine glycosylase
LYTFDCEYLSGEPQAIGCAAWEWVSLNELERFPFPVTDQKIIAALNDGGQLAMDLPENSV